MGQSSLPRTAGSRRGLAGILALFPVAMAGCGSSNDTAATSTPAPTKRTLVLDYQPNAVHAGLAAALRAGDFRRRGLDLTVLAPSSTSDALTQVGRGKADFGLADLIDVARRNDRALRDPAAHHDPAVFAKRGGVQVVGAVVQQPLSGILVSAKGAIRSPQQLAGKRIAVTGLPSDLAVVNAIVRRGTRPLATTQITLGFDGLKALDAGRVDGATAYWPADAVTLEELGTPARAFKLSDAGVSYPGLVAFVRPGTPAAKQAKAFAEAMRAGTAKVIADPAAGERALAAQYPELDPGITKRQLANYVPLFGTATTATGVSDAALQRFSAFAASAKLISRPRTPAELRGAIAH